jgi:hypothetical protein
LVERSSNEADADIAPFALPPTSGQFPGHTRHVAVGDHRDAPRSAVALDILDHFFELLDRHSPSRSAAPYRPIERHSDDTPTDDNALLPALVAAFGYKTGS